VSECAVRKRASGGECVAAASTGGKCAVETGPWEIADRSGMVEALRAIRDEIRRVTALIQAVSEPAESITLMEAIRRHVARDQVDAATELAVLFALGDPYVERGPEAINARAHQIVDEVSAQAT
jgi:hypothetical protein